MFILSLVFLAALASSAAQAGIPQNMHGQWIVSDGNLQVEGTVVPMEGVQERVWAQIPAQLGDEVTLMEMSPLTTPETRIHRGEYAEEGDALTWQIFLVIFVMVASAVGSLGFTYYMCVWRGGRIFYKPQREEYTLK